MLLTMVCTRLLIYIMTVRDLVILAYPEPTDEAEMISKFTVLWTQIADRFKDYDEKLLFAGMNELPKGYDKPADAYLQLTNKLNQSFVDTVRAGGGNNPQRILIVQAYNTNAEYAISGLQIPDDTAENKIMAEFHFYDPWSFAGEGRNSWGQRRSDKRQMGSGGMG